MSVLDGIVDVASVDVLLKAAEILENNLTKQTVEGIISGGLLTMNQMNTFRRVSVADPLQYHSVANITPSGIPDANLSGSYLPSGLLPEESNDLQETFVTSDSLKSSILKCNSISMNGTSTSAASNSLHRSNLLGNLVSRQTEPSFYCDRSQLFTAASGLPRGLVRPSDEHESSSSISEIEDMCLDDSESNSLPGQVHSTLRQPVDPSIMFDRGSNSEVVSCTQQSHLRLRSALLSSPHSSFTPLSSQCSGSLLLDQHLEPPSNRCLVVARKTGRTSSSVDLCGPYDSSSASEGVDSSESSRLRHVPSCSSASRQPYRSTSVQPTFDSSHAIDDVSPSSISRQQPSGNHLLRRASCVDCTGGSYFQSNSISQPHSPDFRPRHNSLPVSPCRLPMKKRKLDWSHMSDVSTNMDSHSRSISHLPMTANSELPTSVKQVPKPLQRSSLQSTVTPLVIDCPLSLSEGQLIKNKKKSLDCSNFSSLSMGDVYHRESNHASDGRPHSIPSCTLTVESYNGHNILNRLNESTRTPGSSRSFRLHSLSPNQMESTKDDSQVNGYSKLSLLARTLISAFDASQSATVRIQSSEASSTECSQQRPFHPRDGRCSELSVPLNRRRTGLTPQSLDLKAITNQSEIIKNVDHCQLISNRSITNVNPHLLSQSMGHSNVLQCSSGSALDTKSVSSSSNRLCLSDLVVGNSCKNGNCRPPERSLSSVNQPLSVDPLATSKFSETQPHFFSSNTNGQSFASPSKCGTLMKLDSTKCNSFKAVSCTSSPTDSQVKSAKHSLISPGSELSDTAQILMILSPTVEDGSRSSIATPDQDSGPHGSNQVTCSTGSSSIFSSSNTSSCGFPLLLVSASSSAGAAALAAAAALATGAPPSSLVPVPVQLTSYTSPLATSPKSSLVNMPISNSSEREFRDPLRSQRLLISLCTAPTKD